jgi:hypothetical protein
VDEAEMVISDLKLAAICRKAMHANPDLRYSNTASLSAELTRWMSAKPSKVLSTARNPEVSACSNFTGSLVFRFFGEFNAGILGSEA